MLLILFLSVCPQSTLNIISLSVVLQKDIKNNNYDNVEIFINVRTKRLL